MILIYNCFCIFLDQIWLMARDRMDFPVDLRTKIYDILTKLTLDSDRLVLSSNKNCSMDY